MPRSIKSEMAAFWKIFNLNPFELGDFVTWKRNGVTYIGEVIEVVKAGLYPKEPIRLRGYYRNTTNYLIRLCNTEKVGQLRYPHTASLKLFLPTTKNNLGCSADKGTNLGKTVKRLPPTNHGNSAKGNKGNKGHGEV